MANFRRKIYQLLSNRFVEPRQFIQVLYGPRQVGKTTLAQQIIGRWRWHAYWRFFEYAHGKLVSVKNAQLD